MRVVLNECDRGQSFDLFVICIKNTYQAQGTTPNSPVVRAFYSNLDISSVRLNIEQVQLVGDI